MSREVDYRRRYPCPCGKGEYEEIGSSDDWGRTETEHIMLCSECKERYIYDSSSVYNHPGREVARGWVLKSGAAAKEKKKSKPGTTRLNDLVE